MDNRVSVVGCGSYDAGVMEAALDELLGRIGGLDWVAPGMRVAVKPNLVIAHAPEKAATTHPALVGALCRRLIERGAEVVVGDSPGGPYSQAYLDIVYRSTGMTAVEASGARLNRDFGETLVKVEQGRAIKRFWCCDFLLKADAVIDFCKLKTHGMMGYTGACKNLFGAITGMHKTECHYQFPDHAQFASMLVDVCEFIGPRLSICDGVLAMEGNGPSFGTPRPMGVLLASFNPHALDLAAASLIGLTPESVPTLAEAARRGLAPDSVSGLQVLGELDRFRANDFQLQPRLDIRYWGIRSDLFNRAAKRFVVTRPEADKRCVGCGKCAQVCPAKAIVIRRGRPKIDRNQCISCFCCAEFCPKGAMKPFEPVLGRLMRGKRGS